MSDTDTFKIKVEFYNLVKLWNLTERDGKRQFLLFPNDWKSLVITGIKSKWIENLNDVAKYLFWFNNGNAMKVKFDKSIKFEFDWRGFKKKVIR